MQGTLGVKQQETGREFETPAGESGQITNLLELSQVRDKLLSLKLDQVRFVFLPFLLSFHVSRLVNFKKNR